MDTLPMVPEEPNKLSITVNGVKYGFRFYGDPKDIDFNKVIHNTDFED